MNCTQLIYALSEKSLDDFKIRSHLLSNQRRHSHTQEEKHDKEDTGVETTGADSEQTLEDETTTPHRNLNSLFRPIPSLEPQFFQVANEEVVKLTNERGSEVYLLGTNHASPESRIAVDSLIKQITPQVVVVELCKTRIGLNPMKTFQRNRSFDLFLLKDAVAELGISAGFIWYSMAYMERFISRLLNVDYGADMRAAGTSTFFQVTNSDLLEGEHHDYRIMLGDRPIEITIKRMASILTPAERAAIWFFNTCSAILGLKCYLLNVPTVLFRSHKFNRVLLDERDVYLTYSLQMAAELSDVPVKVIGIVGKAHVPGILSRWETVTRDEVKRISTDNVQGWYRY